jgi:hypothetical protein
LEQQRLVVFQVVLSELLLPHLASDIEEVKENTGAFFSNLTGLKLVQFCSFSDTPDQRAYARSVVVNIG